MSGHTYNTQHMDDAYQVGLVDGTHFGRFILELNGNLASLNKYQLALIDVVSELAPDMAPKLTRELVHRYLELQDIESEEEING